jgi:hypothetical protein
VYLQELTLTETILEAALDVSQVSHTTSTGSLSSLALFGPVEGSNLGSRVATLGTSLLLLMERAVATTSTESVGLGMTLTEGTGTFGL